MAAKISNYLSRWTGWVPVLAIVALILSWGRELAPSPGLERLRAFVGAKEP